MRRFFKAVLSVGMSLLYFIFWLILISMLNLVKDPDFTIGDPSLARLWYEFLPLIITLFLNLIFRKISRLKRDRTGVLKFIKNFFLGLIFGLLWIGLAIFIIKFAGIVELGKGRIPDNLHIFSLALFLNTIMQEYLVRGYMFDRISKRSNNTLAVIFTSLVFTLLHGGAFEVGIIGVLNVFSMSILMSILLLMTGGLVAPIMVHFVWNFVGGLLLKAVSLAEDYPSVYDVTFTGKKLLTGGSFKLEGSIVVLFINIVAIAFLYRKTRNKREFSH